MVRQEVKDLAHELVRGKPPKTQEDCCELAAYISVRADLGPWTDERIKLAAASGASGLFGPLFNAADDEQREAWIAMYERAIRNALKHV